MNPTRNKVLIEPIESVTEQGIILPFEKQEKIKKGTVLAIGPECTQVKVGDVVMYNPTQVPFKTQHEGKECLISAEDALLLILL